MKYFEIIAATLLSCGCAQKENGPVYEKPQPNPTGVKVETIGKTSDVMLSWKDNSSTELGYDIWVSTGSDAPRRVAELGPDTVSYLIKKELEAGKTYNVGVQTRGTEEKLCSRIIFKEVSLFDWSRLPVSVLKDDTVVTPSSIAVDYSFRKSAEFEILDYGLCWSADHTPTLDDAFAYGPKASSVTVRQAIPVSSLEYGVKYKVRGFVRCSKDIMYSNEIQVELGDEIPAVTFNWTEVQAAGLHEDIKVYSTSDKLHGRVFNGWYAVADVTRGNVEFRMQFADKAKNMSVFYKDNQNAGETAYVLTNAGYFNMSTGKTGDYHVDKGVSDASTATSTPRGVFGVDAAQKPFAVWGGKGTDGIEYFYDNPMMTLGNTSVYENCREGYPEPDVKLNPYYAMCAGPLLVKNGKVMPDVTMDGEQFVRNYEGIWTDIFNDGTVTPDRTCVGYTADGKIILFVCDGRIKSSQGASIVEAAQIMKGLGCVGAVNFDGGGSTAMLVQGTRLNSLESNMSGGTEDRAVGSVMGFFLNK